MIRSAIALFFLLSGATALVYQVVWVRMLGLAVGHSVLAVSVVVATFMAGLGLGARVSGGIAARLRRPLAAYGAMEMCVGLFALCSPAVLGAAERLASLLPAGGGALAGVLAAAALTLLAPTFAMGATLPLLARWLARDDARLGLDMGLLYAINTTGAGAGAALAGFVLLPRLGQPATLALAAAVNVAVGLAAIVLGLRRSRPGDLGEDVAVQASPEAAGPPGARAAVLGAFAISGAAALANQVAWSRAFVLFVGSTTYAFSLIVCAFIAGLALGSHAFARVVDRVPDRVRLLGGVNLAIAAATALLIPLLGELPLVMIRPLAALSSSFGRSQALVLGTLFALVVVPTFLMGGTWPVAIRALARDARSAASTVGRASAWNTGGAVVGSLLCGLLLLPLLGIRNTLWLAVGLNLVAAGVLLGSRRRVAWALPLLAVAGALVAPPWNPRHMNLAPHMYARDLAHDEVALAEMRDSGSILFHEEGLGATVTVIQRSSGDRVLRIDGKTDASFSTDRLYQAVAGTLPLLLSRERDSALLVGLGSGMSLAAVLDQPVARATVVELLPEVARGARAFDDLLGAPLTDPRTRLDIGDGRHRLLRGGETFDAIGSNPTNLFVSGMSSLLTVEFFRAMRRSLRPGGVALVWVQGYLLRDGDFLTVLRTFQSVFPETTLWNGGFFDFFMVGTAEPLALDWEVLSARIAALQGSRAAAWTGLREVSDLQRHYLAGPATVRLIAGDGPVQRDADPFLEFSAPRALYGAGDLLDCERLLARREPLPLGGAVPGLDLRLEAARRIDASGLGSDAEALGAALALDTTHPAGRSRLARLEHARALDAAMAGDLAGAEQTVRRVLDLEPLALTSWRLLAAVQEHSGRTAEALATLRLARDGQPWNPYAHLAVAGAAQGAGLDAEARQARAEAEKLDPALPELRNAR